MSREVAFVTAGGSGLGGAAARALAARGAAVTIFDVSQEALEENAQVIRDAGGEVLVVQGDVADDAAQAAAVAETVERFGGLDTVAACAGILSRGSVTEVDPAEWQRVLDVNLTGMFITARHTLPELVRRGGGSFVGIASDAGIEGAPNVAAYCVSKHGVIGLVRCIALGYGEHGVRANAICPGSIRTAMLDQYIGMLPPEEQADVVENHPTGDPEDVANVVRHLSSDEAKHTNNLIYVINNGDVVDRTKATVGGAA